MNAIVERFLLWSKSAPVPRRAEAAAVLARAYLVSDLTPEQRDQVEASMTALLDDCAIEVRRALAEVLAPSEKAPHHLILLMAGDKPPVAAVVAEHSPLILDRELVDLIAGRDETVQCAIGRRPYVSRAVSAALGEVGSAEACLALLNNSGARVPRFSLDRIVERHGDVPELRLHLMEREDTPPDVRQALLGRLSSSLRELVVSREWLTPERADTVTRDARECATIAAAFEISTDSMPALVAELVASGELTPAFLIRAVANGQAALFEAALASLSAMPRRRVAALIASGRAASLTALLDKAGLPAGMHPAFIAAIDVIRHADYDSREVSDYRRATSLMEAIIARYGTRKDRELDQVLALLRRYAVDAKRTAARGYVQQVLEAA